MKTYEEMAENALKRIRQTESERKRRRAAAMKIAAPTVGVCLAAVVGIGVRQTEVFRNHTPSVDAGITDTDAGTFTSAVGSDVETPGTADPQTVTEIAAPATDTGTPVQPFPDEPDVTVTDSGGNTAPATDAANPVQSFPNEPDVTVTVPSVQSGGTAGAAILWWKNRFNTYGALYFALENDPDAELAVTASYCPVTGEIDSFVFEGETLAELAVEAADEKILPLKMRELLKMGDELAYGPALYETGLPSGIKWDRRLYEDKIAYYGEKLLETYIVDGVFLAEQLEKDIAAMEAGPSKADETYRRAYEAYLDTILPQVEKKLTESGFRCERSGDTLTLRVTAAELETLPLDDLAYWYFDLVSDGETTGAVQTYVHTADAVVF